jgi:peptidoglycan hydrolase-like protein with peptidoglycan-binding domain
MKYITPIVLVLTLLIGGLRVQATNNPTLLVHEPVVSAITPTTATVSVPQGMLSTLTAEQKAGLHFEYIPTGQVCIMIYPTPESCLPKKTINGQMSVVLQNLKPSTTYTVSYKVDNTIACITTPCPENGLQSGRVEFTTPASGAGMAATFYRNLQYRSRGDDVAALQDILRSQGYLNTQSTGYFGIATFKGVKAFQKGYMRIAPTGFVGPKTRAVLNALPVPIDTQGEYFSGTIQTVSTACFADGECSVTIDGKKVVTTIGWSQAIVGSIKGSVSSIGDIETSKIGARANVYAQKTTDGYTLYGNAAYYIEVL